MKVARFVVLISLFTLAAPHSLAQSIEDITSGKDSNDAEEKDMPTPSRSSSSYGIPSTLKTHSVGIGIGQTFLKSDLEDVGEDKITWDLLYEYAASHSFNFFANFHTSKHEFRGTWARITALALGIKAKVFQFDNFAPFGVAGLGFYEPKVKRRVDGQMVESESKLTFGWHFGGGADLQLNEHFKTGLMLHVHDPFDVKQENGPEVEGWYYKLLITGMYTF